MLLKKEKKYTPARVHTALYVLVSHPDVCITISLGERGWTDLFLTGKITM